jgi:Cu/Ag efflux pump CusA
VTIVVRVLRFVYEPTLHWSLAHRKTMVLIGVMFLGVVGLFGTRLGGEYLPHLEEGNLWIRVQLPPSTGLDSGTPATRKLREVLFIPRSSPPSPSTTGRTTAATLRHSPTWRFSRPSSRSTSGRQA